MWWTRFEVFDGENHSSDDSKESAKGTFVLIVVDFRRCTVV